MNPTTSVCCVYFVQYTLQMTSSVGATKMHQRLRCQLLVLCNISSFDIGLLNRHRQRAAAIFSGVGSKVCA